MLNTKFLISLFILACGFQVSYGVVGFTQNDGQIVDQNGKINEHVLFSSSSKTWQVLLNENGFSYQNTSSNSDVESNLFMIKRMDVNFRGMNRGMQIETFDELLTKLNYPSIGDGGICGVSSFSKVIYKNVYPNIDVAFQLSLSGQFEYDFILNAGANISDIQLEYKGCENIGIANNKLTYTFASQNITESIPSAFELCSGHELSFRYILNESCISFIGNYNHDVACVIDPTPTLAFASYFGAESGDYGPGASLSSIGEFISVGTTYSTGNLATSGAFQTIHYGSSSAYLLKLDPLNQIVWCTYFGGSGTTTGLSVNFVDDQNIFMAGATTSTDHIATAGALVETLSGATANFLAHFNSDGALLWSSYFSPSPTLTPNGTIAIDKIDNNKVAIAFATYATDLPVSADALQGSNAGSEDLCIGIFNMTNHTFEWLTYMGGVDHDFVFDIEVNGGSLYISSVTLNAGLATSGAFLESMPNVQSILISKIDLASKALQWSTYMHGSDPTISLPRAFLAVDENFVYCNSTASLAGLATPGVQDESLSGPLDIFISKMSLDGDLIWSRYFGGTGKEIGGAICVENGQIYIGGVSASSDAIATADAPFTTIHHTTPTSTIYDNCYAAFDTNGGLIWGTYFGDYAMETLPTFIDAKANSIWAASTSMNTSTQSMHAPFATPDAFQQENAGDIDVCFVKFDVPTEIADNLFPLTLSIYPNPTSGLCSIVGLKDCSKVDVISTTGQLVLKSNVGVGQSQISLDLSDLASGYYTLRIFNAKGESIEQYPVVRQ